MQRILILSLIILGITKSLSAQTTITGVVTDSLNNPVPYASVYLNNTTVGGYTDNQGVYSLTVPEEGTYEIVGTCIGYKTFSRVINIQNRTLYLNIQLQINPVVLSEVVVNARSANRIKNYSNFVTYFIGQSENAKSCKIDNLKDLRLYGDANGNFTRGYSIKPLIIQNKALGYNIVYDLSDFSYNINSKILRYSGNYFFSQMEGSEKKMKKWHENRMKTYYGSRIHLIRALYSRTARQEGFDFLECDTVNGNLKEGKPVNEKYLFINRDDTCKYLYYKKNIYARYFRQTADDLSKQFYSSNLLFLDTISIHKNGFYNDPYQLFITGDMGKERIADLLPFDFIPDQDTIQHIENENRYTINNGILAPYESFYSTPREQVYTHFNKSCNSPGDDIWFTNYILDQTKGLPCSETHILYVDLYDPTGKLQEQRILNVEGGVASGSFKLTKANVPGKYTFRAYTNWMKNFNSPEECSTFIDVVGITEKDSLPENRSFDVQFLPESGTFLEGVLNRVGVKALDPNGRGVKLTGDIVDEQNKVKAKFKLNQFGMGDFVMTPKSTETYKARVYLPDGKEQLFDLPKTEEKGIIIKLKESSGIKDTVVIISNLRTIRDGVAYYFLLHNEGEVLKSASIYLSALETSASIPIGHNQMANGTNCITVFNKSFKPVAEKMFFKLRNSSLGKIDIQQKLINDTIEFSISSTDSLGNTIPAKMSMSVLPEGTISDKFSTSLYSEALLRPGLSGVIENADYYFERNDKEHRKALDLLFLTQGWRKYNWGDIRNDTLEHPNTFETAFSIEGKVDNGNFNDVVSVISPENQLLLLKSLNSDGKFQFPFLWLIDKSMVVISASEENTGRSRRIKLEAAINPTHMVDSIIKNEMIKFSDNSEINAEEPLKLLKDEIMLDEVVVVEKARKDVFDQWFYKPFSGKVYVINKENCNKYATFERLLLFEFGVNIIKLPDGEILIDMNSGRATEGASLIIDDFNYKTDYFYFNFLSESTVEAVSVVKDGNAILGTGGAIIIKTRKEPILWDYIKPDNIQFLKVKGFAAPVTYYTPQYLYPVNSDIYKKYATIFWKPDIITDNNGKASFRFAVPSGIKVLKVRTEGFSDMGVIFCDKRLIQVESAK